MLIYWFTRFPLAHLARRNTGGSWLLWKGLILSANKGKSASQVAGRLHVCYARPASSPRRMLEQYHRSSDLQLHHPHATNSGDRYLASGCSYAAALAREAR